MALPLLFPLRSERKQKTYRQLEHFSESEIRKLCGATLPVVREITQLYEPLHLNVCPHIPLETKVLLFLTQLRSGSFQKVCGATTNTSQSTASRVIDALSDHTLTFAPSVIDFPSSVNDLNTVKQRFYDIAGLTGVIGIVDGTQVSITAPTDNEPACVNRKFGHSINCQVVADEYYKLFDIVAKWPGSTHDSFIWRNSSVRRRLNSGEFGDSYFLADSGYGAERRLKVPLRGNLTPDQAQFNRALKKTRSIVERAIGNWKSRFRSMHGTGGHLCYNPQKSCKLIVSSVVLRNIFVTRNIPILDEDNHYLENYLLPGLQEDNSEN